MTDEIKSDVNIIKEVHGPFYDLAMRSDGIVRASTYDSAWITMDNVMVFLDGLKELTGSIPHPTLYIPGRHMSIDKEARTFMASDEGMQYTSALAVVVQSLPHRVIGNLFISIDRPKKPVKNFENENDAIEWLKEQKSS